MSSELLPKKETRDQPRIAGSLNMPRPPDLKKFRELLELRRKMLAAIKKQLSLKTYNLVAEKLETEKALLEQLSAQRKQQLNSAENFTGALPKDFFELGALKPKSIRID